MSEPLVENGDLRVKRCRYGLMLYSVHDVYIGRSFDLYGEYCEQEVEVYKRLLKPGCVVVDAGANIGSHTLAFARIAGPKGAVFAFEPQRIIFQRLCSNMALNGIGNVRAWHAGVGAGEGTARVPPIDYASEGNFGGTALTADGPGETVPVVPIDTLALTRCSLIKIDVQGMETEVLEGARETIARCEPLLYVENDLKEKSAELIETLLGLGYRLHWHFPKLYQADNYFRNPDNVFHRVINVNMLCLPPSDTRKTDLTPITSPNDWWKDH